MLYPIHLEKDEDGIYIVTLKDFPGATQGNTKEEALKNAVDLLETAIAYAIHDGENIPSPSQGKVTVRPSSLTIAKVKLYLEMRKQNVNKATLARRMRCDPKQVSRLLDIHHKSKLNQIDEAFLALGKTIDIEIRKAI